MEIQETQNSQNHMEKQYWKSLSDFKTYYKGRVIKRVWYIYIKVHISGQFRKGNI